MLKQLLIKNIILIESADINFGSGLNVLSGETGSGKSAIMNALNLIFGGRSDASMIRRGSEKGIVEAFFDIDKNPQLNHLLEEAGIDHEENEDLIIRREITETGKNRCFINNQAAQAKFLHLISPYLGTIVGQHANQWLLLTDKHREIVDIYGELKPQVLQFGKQFLEENSLSKELIELVQNESKRFLEIDMYRMQLQEIEEANLKTNEDDEIFAEYSLLMNAETRAIKVNEISEKLFGEKLSVLTLLNKQQSAFEYLAEIDPELKEASVSYHNALIELQEIAYTLRSYQSRIEYNPQRAEELNDRLALITKLKKKYGSTLSEIEEYKNTIVTKLDSLENVDLKIESLQQLLDALKDKNNVSALYLSEQRKKTAKKLEKAIVKELRSLNMPKVEFEIQFTPQKRGIKGDDLIEFYLIPNVGEHKIPIRECASGGELSRILLAIQSLLAGKEQTPSLIFDEIDANIGGETAFIVGEKLKAIGQETQVLCITHFPQVAKQADHHLQISKVEENGRTFTRVVNLEKEETKSLEISRMLGGK